jgi:hypothetical protein
MNGFRGGDDGRRTRSDDGGLTLLTPFLLANDDGPERSSDQDVAVDGAAVVVVGHALFTTNVPYRMDLALREHFILSLLLLEIWINKTTMVAAPRKGHSAILSWYSALVLPRWKPTCGSFMPQASGVRFWTWSDTPPALRHSSIDGFVVPIAPPPVFDITYESQS